MLHFVYPELFLLALPVLYVWYRWGRAPGVTGALRLLLLCLLLVALAGAELNIYGRGLDVVVVADRSRSLPPEAEPRIRELIRSLQTNRRTGDRVGIVTFGSAGAVESALSAEGDLGEYTKVVEPNGSDLNDALHLALGMLGNSQRPGRVLVLSDGEANGPSPLSAARRARDLGVPIDYRDIQRLKAGDVAIEAFVLPDVVGRRDPFQYSLSIFADRPADATLVVTRDGETVAKSQRRLQVGSNRLVFRDVLDGDGLHRYEARVEVDNDPLPDNNIGAGVVRVNSGPRLLVLNGTGQDDNFVRALRAGQIEVDVAQAAQHPLTQESLDRYRAVVLENVPAADLGRVKMQRLAQYVQDLGGGLCVTGGERSFGMGGYFHSPLDEVLPVSMELRQEHRRLQLALVVALDRSGSMAAPVRGGKQKMDLANLGTAEAIRLLSPGDSVAVIAVDSSPHTIQALTRVEDANAIASKVLGIRSMGGGIFVYEALVAAGNEIMKAEQATKHIILFSDAADSEEPGAWKTLLSKYETAGITVSVIGLGAKSDSDAKLLEDIAHAGHGNIMFTDDAEELPRLFAQDTMSIARSTFIKKDAATQAGGIPGKLVSSAQLIGEFKTDTFPAVDGYNLSYIKPDATLVVESLDEYHAPLVAAWYRGLGRALALSLEVDGPYSGAFGQWNEYADFLISHGRWLLGPSDDEDAFVSLAREGQEAVVNLELDPERPGRKNIESPALRVAVPGSETSPPLDIPFQWRGPNTLQARFKLTQTGTYLSRIQLYGRNTVRVPAVTLPYSAEFAPRPVEQGKLLLRQLAEITGGKERLQVVEILADPPRAARLMSLLPWLLTAAVGLLIIEIAGRRLSWWVRIPAAPALPREVPAMSASQLQTAPRAWWQRLGSRVRGAPAMRPVSRTSPGRAPAAATPGGERQAPAAPTSPADAKPAAPSPIDVFAQAKARARQRRND